METPLIVLDDDPTGTQAVTQVPVLLEWSVEDLRAAGADGAASIHLLTNSRALEPDRARELVADAVGEARAAYPGAQVLLRGDSTLRAHLVEEYLGVCEAAHGGRRPPLLLVPALPTAGRITIDGVHLIERDGARTPLHETEYARDPSFAYDDAHLLRWAQHRSGGLLPADQGRTVPLHELRSGGPGVVHRALTDLAGADGPAACAPDAETVEDVELIAEGLRRAHADGLEVVVRGSPTFAGALAGTASTAPAPMPDAPDGVLLVCGSYVPTTSRQLAALEAAYPDTGVVADVLALADPVRADTEIERLAGEVGSLLARGRLAVVTTPRERPDGTRDLISGERIANNLARVVAAVDPFPSVVVAKGGITSAVTARVGLDCRVALTVGPVVPGVALWHARREGDGEVPYLVVPGNVGGDELLRTLVDGLLGTS
jgi:uncharacterized protein YgbK (DUF1537 family)